MSVILHRSYKTIFELDMCFVRAVLNHVLQGFEIGLLVHALVGDHVSPVESGNF